MSVVDDAIAAIAANTSAVDSAVLAFQARDAHIADLVAQLAAAGEISAAAAEKLTAGIGELQGSDVRLAEAAAANVG